MGATFKENCPDIRNSKVPDIYYELESFGMQVDLHDPYADSTEVKHEYNIDLTKDLQKYDAIVFAVAHQQYLDFDFEPLKANPQAVVYDIKAILPPSKVDARL